MSSPRLESFLARIYADEAFRTAFVAAPRNEALRYGLTVDEANQLADTDMIGLRMAAESFRSKKSKRGGRMRKYPFARLLQRIIPMPVRKS